MSNNWLNNIKYVAPGEPVKAGIVSRPDMILAERTEYLKQRLDAAEIGRAVFDHDATIASNVLPGQPVYWNATNSRYELALAAVVTDPETEELVTTSSTDCIGICYKKRSETLADIVLYGVISLADISNAVAEPVAAGRYYLSNTEAGKLVNERPAVPVVVCYVFGPKDNCSDVPLVMVSPQNHDFLEAFLGSDRHVVTSLRPAAGSPITVKNLSNVVATTGDLQLGLNLQLLTAEGEALGGQAFKEITDDYKLKRGWVAEGIRVGAGALTVTGTRTRQLTTAEKTALGLPINLSASIAQGIVTISYDDQLVEREISPQIIRLSDTVERLYQDIPYLGFPQGQDSLLRVRLNVPSANLGSSLRMFIRAQLFGRQTAALPTMAMTYRILPRPTATAGTPLVTNDTALTFTVPTTSVSIDRAIEVTSNDFVVAEGDTVLVTLSREGASDSYGAEVGLLRLTGIVAVQ